MGNVDAGRRWSWPLVISSLVFACGIVGAVLFPSTTVKKWHEQCIPDPCRTVFGPVTNAHLGIRFLIAFGAAIVAVIALAIELHQRRSTRSAWLQSLRSEETQ